MANSNNSTSLSFGAVTMCSKREPAETHLHEQPLQQACYEHLIRPGNRRGKRNECSESSQTISPDLTVALAARWPRARPIARPSSPSLYIYKTVNQVGNSRASPFIFIPYCPRFSFSPRVFSVSDDDPFPFVSVFEPIQIPEFNRSINVL